MKIRIFLLTSLLLALLMQPWQSSLASTNSTEITIFDFSENAAYAQWRSGAGDLPFPGTAGDYRGFAQKIPSPLLEDGQRGLLPGLLAVPHDKVDGYIQGTYPEYTVQKNDRFQTMVGCEYGATGCYVTFRLDYVTEQGVPKIFWQWKEKYDGKPHSVDLDLSALAGKKVRFVLTLLASGTASGDRALWFFPRIARQDNPQPTLPVLTPTATPFASPPPVNPSTCDKAAFVADVTVRDGTSFAPGEAFTKGWRLRNAGSCTWTKDYSIVFYSGEQMGAPTSVNMPWSVAPGKTVEVAVNAIAPQTAGTHQSYWILRNASGQLFGIGSSGANPFWMLINVTGSAPVSKAGYDFVANTCAAQWQSGAGALTCPQTDGDSRGFALAKEQATLEDGLVATPALLTQPQDKYNGYIQGIYPTFLVQPGDRFKAVVGCEQNANCYVTYRLEYLTATGSQRVFWQWKERSDKKTYTVDLDLTPLAGQSLRFILTTLASGPATGDRALWAGARIFRPGLFPPAPTMPPTATPDSGPGTIVSSPIINSLSMIDASNGWAIGDNCVLRTLNGGATWRKVLPDVAVSGSYFQNSTNAWVIQNSGTLYRTTDGGYKWTQYTFPFCSEHLESHLQFLNSNNGFLMTGGPIGMFKYPISLYQTADGGANWTLKFTHGPPATSDGLPLGGYKHGMIFRDTKNGWIGGGNYPGEGYLHLFRTTDGGVNWTHVQPAFPAGYETAYIDTTAPKFFSTTDGILPVWMSIGSGMRDLFLYVTHDGGNTWTPSAGYARNAVAVDFISINNAISWDYSGNFYVTNNAGRSWTTVTPNVNFGEGYRALDFISPTTGWLILSPVNGSTPLYHTVDGGRTWTILSGGYVATPEPAVLAQSIVDALNARNFDFVKNNMEQTFAFAYWQSQGNAASRDQAIESLRTAYVGTTTLIADPNQDLTALLGGYSPYALMGLDPARSYALYVSGWGLDGRTEAILYLTRRADGSLYFFGLLIAPTGFIHTTATPTPSPTPTATETPTPTSPPPTPGFTSPFAVMGIPAGQTLLVYSAASGTDKTIIGEFPAEAKSIERGMYTNTVDGISWVYVYSPEKRIGWVDDQYLTEYVTPATFADDPRVAALIASLKQAMNNADGDLFATLVSPKHGVRIGYHGTQGPGIVFMPEQARNAFTSTESISWGPEGASGMDAVGTFSEKVKPKLLEALNAGYELTPNTVRYAYMYSEPWPTAYQNLNFVSLLKPPTPEVVFDWREWLVGVEYVNGKPYIVSLLHYVWEP